MRSFGLWLRSFIHDKLSVGKSYLFIMDTKRETFKVTNPK